MHPLFESVRLDKPLQKQNQTLIHLLAETEKTIERVQRYYQRGYLYADGTHPISRLLHLIPFNALTSPMEAYNWGLDNNERLANTLGITTDIKRANPKKDITYPDCYEFWFSENKMDLTVLFEYEESPQDLLDVISPLHLYDHPYVLSPQHPPLNVFPIGKTSKAEGTAILGIDIAALAVYGYVWLTEIRKYEPDDAKSSFEQMVGEYILPKVMKDQYDISLLNATIRETVELDISFSPLTVGVNHTKLILEEINDWVSSVAISSLYFGELLKHIPSVTSGNNWLSMETPSRNLPPSYRDVEFVYLKRISFEAVSNWNLKGGTQLSSIIRKMERLYRNRKVWDTIPDDVYDTYLGYYAAITLLR